MPSSGRRQTRLVDTSGAVPLLVADHEQRDAVVVHVSGLRLGLAGHAALETYSVLTRLPQDHRPRPAEVLNQLLREFPSTHHLSSDGAARLYGELAGLGIVGGAVYDALVGAAAREARLTLVTRDRRALPTYRALGVEVDVIEAPS